MNIKKIYEYILSDDILSYEEADEAGLKSASVLVEGTNNGTVVNEKGNFILKIRKIHQTLLLFRVPEQVQDVTLLK